MNRRASGPVSLLEYSYSLNIACRNFRQRAAALPDDERHRARLGLAPRPQTSHLPHAARRHDRRCQRDPGRLRDRRPGALCRRERFEGLRQRVVRPAAGQPTRKSRKEFFDKLKYNRELKLADERYLELINSDNTLYSAYRNSTIDTKRDDLTSEDTTIIGAAADLADIRDMVMTEGRFFSRTEEQSAAFGCSYRR